MTGRAGQLLRGWKWSPIGKITQDRSQRTRSHFHRNHPGRCHCSQIGEVPINHRRAQPLIHQVIVRHFESANRRNGQF